MLNRKIAAVTMAAAIGLGALTGCTPGAKPNPTATQSNEGGVIDPTANPTKPTTSGTVVPTAAPSTTVPGNGDTGINIETTPTASTSSNPTSSSTVGNPTSTGAPTTTTDRTNNPACEGVGMPIKRGEPGYTTERDKDGDGVACETGDGGPDPTTAPTSNPTSNPTTSNPTTRPTTNPTTQPSTGDQQPTRPVNVPVGSTIIAKITTNTKIYSAPSVTSEVIGEGTSGGQFKGTVTSNGYWIKIDRSPGYIKADAITVAQVIN